MRTRRLLVVVLLIGITEAYRSFQDRIPNGDHVPHPCKPNYIWWGVGHMNPLGGGDRNPFGRDFARFKNWTTELCRMDSDGDGYSNGQELGDPDCTWTQGATPKRTKGITHPGVCDPWGDEKCREANKLVTCDTGEFICEGLDSPDVFNITLRFPPTQVPAEETTYMCFTFELDMLEPDSDYHLIAFEPFIDNSYVMHHTTVTGCGESSTPLAEPKVCNMADSACQISLAVWTLGMPGDCIYHEAGFKIGRTGLKRLNMQHHWTNPERKTNYVDSSGMILYLTKKLRRYNAAYFTTGQMNLQIPPGENRWVESATCPSVCTERLLKAPVKLMTGWNHMHYLGYKQNVELYRDDIKIKDLTPDEVYSYDNPVVHVYKPLVELLPGDRLETTCVFRSTSRTKTTTFGLGTYDEMCFGVFTYFPAENIEAQACLSHDDVEFCRGDKGLLYGCDLTAFFNDTNPETIEIFEKILENCNAHGLCRKECQRSISEVRKHPCMYGKMGKYVEDMLVRYAPANADIYRFLGGLRSCQCSADGDDDKWPFPSHATRQASPVTLIGLFLTISIIHMFSLE